MRNLMLACAGVALLGGVVSITLWRELRDERALSAQLQKQLNDRPAFAAAPAGGPGRPLPLPQANTPALVSDGQPAAVAPPPGAVNAERPPIAPAAGPRLVINRQELMKDPEYRKAQLAQVRMSLPQNYPGMVQELGLTPEEADRLFDLLAEQQIEMNDAMPAIINGVRPDPEEMRQLRADTQRRHQDALLAMLGNRHSQLQEYEQTRQARQQVTQLGQMFGAVGVPPLTTEQSRPLIAAYDAEQKRQRDVQQTLIRQQQQANPLEQVRMAEERLRLQSESNRRLLDAAKPHLNAQQLATLQNSLDQQLAMNRATSRLMRRQLESTQTTSAVPGNTIPIPIPIPAP